MNYYGLVRPQQNFQTAIQNLQNQQLMAGSAPAAQPEGSELPGTGVPVQFMNHQVYFLNLGSGGAGFGSGMTAGRTGTAQFGAGLQAAPRPAPRTR